MSNETDVRQLAEEHVDWLISFIAPIIRKVGIEEFIHGYKHGQDSMRKETENGNSKQT